MTQEEENILLKDLCSRLPYGVICKLSAKGANISITEKLEIGGLEHFIFGTMDVRPYLRPMDSMTEEEIEFMGENGFRVYKKTNCFDNNCDVSDDGWDNFYVDKQSFEGVIDLFYSHHLDYHGLIPMGLALEAPEGMYKIE